MYSFKKFQNGFTIIEVLIVLVIAALILMIVFYAVPSVRRSSRNLQRKNDGASLAAAINECMTNSNHNVNYCSHPENVPITTSEFQIISTVSYAKLDSSGEPIDCPSTDPDCAATDVYPTNSRLTYLFWSSCDNDGNATYSPIKVRFIVAVYVETGGIPSATCIPG